jgi:hypothetical protein
VFVEIVEKLGAGENLRGGLSVGNVGEEGPAKTVFPKLFENQK